MNRRVAQLVHRAAGPMTRLAYHAARLTGADYLQFVGVRAVAERALELGDHCRAAVLANELLSMALRYRGDWYYGNAIHHGHLLLGRAALLIGDRETARDELLRAATTPGSPQLNSFGPNMRLARELLELGERSLVLEYLRSCSTFWEHGHLYLTNWSSEISEGKTPDFGPNLSY